MNINNIFRPPQDPTPEQVERAKAVYDAFLQFATTLDDTLFHNQDTEACFELLRQARDKALSACRYGRSILTPDVVHRLFEPIEAQDQLVGRVYFNVVDYAELRKFGRDELNIEHKAEKLRQGIQGHIWTSEIRINRKIPSGYALVLAEQDMNEPDFDPEKGPDPSRLSQIF